MINTDGEKTICNSAEKARETPIVIYELVGWFGDQHWSESLYLRKEDAEHHCKFFWKERCGFNTPKEYKGLAKFAIEERIVI